VAQAVTALVPAVQAHVHIQSDHGESSKSYRAEFAAALNVWFGFERGDNGNHQNVNAGPGASSNASSNGQEHSSEAPGQIAKITLNVNQTPVANPVGSVTLPTNTGVNGGENSLSGSVRPGTEKMTSVTGQPAAGTGLGGVLATADRTLSTVLGPAFVSTPFAGQDLSSPATPPTGPAQANSAQLILRPGLTGANLQAASNQMPAGRPEVAGLVVSPLNQETLGASLGDEAVQKDEDVYLAPSDLLRDLMPLEVTVPSETVAASLDPFEALGGDVTALLRGMGVSPWVFAVAAGGLALELSRRCKLRPGAELTVGAGSEGGTFNWLPEDVPQPGETS